MRVRLYEMGTAAPGTVYRIDHFPVSLSAGRDGDLFHRGADSTQCCLLEDVGGVIYMKADAVEEVAVNDAPMRQGEILPGDRLQLGDRSFLISYERMSTVPAGPTHYRIRG